MSARRTRLPAEQLEQAVTRRLWKVLEDHDLLDHAISEAYQRLAERTDEQASEHEAVQRKLTETRAAMDRYFRAFENATMPEDTCAPRLAALGEQAKALEGRAAELAAAADDTEHPERVTPADLDALPAVREPCGSMEPAGLDPQSALTPRPALAPAGARRARRR